MSDASDTERVKGRNDFAPDDIELPRPASLPVRVAREVGVPIVAVLYMALMTFLRFYDKLGEASFVGLVATPVAGYIGSVVPKLRDAMR